ncbi:ABC transporter permease [Acetobacter estunensis]|uniref:cell division protein FtsX n=1 Tax=Acetobacter estunensis TaxID=104097 RepID=UPI001C2DC6BE|nr:cell division protein FtsX [Acetobacter estunensis]MBV1838310.1 cell division protein FtsX [Acetobacter estunensis]
MSSRKQARDGLALAHALPDRSLIAMVAAMSLLAALTFAGAFGARELSARWARGAANLMTVQVPDPEKPAIVPSDSAAVSRADAVLSLLQTLPSLRRAHRLNAQELDRLLAPWLGNTGTSALPLPAVIEVDLTSGATLPDTFVATVQSEAPGTLIERNDDWREQLHAIARSLLVCAALAITLVGGIAAAVIGMATRLGLGARRDSLIILHGLGAPDGYVAGRFARRVALLAFGGGALGTILAVPPIAVVSRLMAPLSGAAVSHETWPSLLRDSLHSLTVGGTSTDLLIGLGCIPLMMTLLGWGTAQTIVRIWLRRLP